MKPPQDVSAILAPYTKHIDAELEILFNSLPPLPMYGQLGFFMGFLNEQFEPEIVYGGKRFRSSLMVMLGEWYGAQATVLPFAVALELYHNFTLIHDDVVDRDTHRRGRPTIWYRYGFDHAINSGDAQCILVSEGLARAAALCAMGPAAQLFLLEKFRLVVEGQYLDFELTNAKLGEVQATAEQYLKMIQGKTAELIIAATKGAGIISGQGIEEQALLAAYGHSLGMAYQICDDVVSIWAPVETSGKRNYGDIKERKKTLPILFAYEHLSASQRAKLEALYAQAELTDEDCEAVIALLDEVDTKSAMRMQINQYSDEAKAAANSLALIEEQRTTLVRLVDSLLPSV